MSTGTIVVLDDGETWSDAHGATLHVISQEQGDAIYECGDLADLPGTPIGTYNIAAFRDLLDELIYMVHLFDECGKEPEDRYPEEVWAISTARAAIAKATGIPKPDDIMELLTGGDA
ncbi:MAG: hypothetical protein Unbinned7358contig1001_16 [Prokaryotic dsDNA virus sp.]|nr:MAG: hypothetical protein Unbinned7358contig1001_16 [Prokaryotic dsDNA virus sp.]|tara:strand:+ start:1257 stop:1607 length:351 start_codon:yes stop_codon:yes gene_type:complete